MSQPESPPANIDEMRGLAERWGHQPSDEDLASVRTATVDSAMKEQLRSYRPLAELNPELVAGPFEVSILTARDGGFSVPSHPYGYEEPEADGSDADTLVLIKGMGEPWFENTSVTTSAEAEGLLALGE
jgi:hypothetical protein